MPAASWRIMPARSIRRCETISRLLGRFAQDGQEITGQAHETWLGGPSGSDAVKAARAAEIQGASARGLPDEKICHFWGENPTRSPNKFFCHCSSAARLEFDIWL